MADFRWSDKTLRYHDARTGRIIPQPSVDALLNDALQRAATDARALTEQLRAGELAIQDWQQAMADMVKQATLTAQALAKGGWDNLTLADEGAAAARIADQLGYLQRYAAQLANGEIPLDGRLGRRSELYVEGARPHYQNTRLDSMRANGVTRARRILHATESCPDCIEYADHDWYPIDEMPAIGDSACGSRCLCSVEYDVEEAA